MKVGRNGEQPGAAKFLSWLAASASSLAITAGLAVPVAMTATTVSAQSAIEEVIVTASKREQSLQDVSAAVVAVGTERLQTGQINNLEDLQLIVPSVTFGNDFNQAKLFIRGVGTNTSTTGSQTGVAFHVDGVVIARAEAQLTSLFDLERVEVLNGPQGSLYGRNAVGGSINLITAKPTEDFEGYGRFTYGRFNEVIAEGAVSGPITNRILGRLAFKTQHRDGFGVNPVTGHDVDNLDRQMGRLELKFLASEDVDLLVSGEYYHQNDASGALKFRRATFPAFQAVPALKDLGAGGHATRARDLASEFDPSTETQTFAVTGNLNWRVNPNITVVNIANYREFTTRFVQDLDTSAIVNSLATTGQPTTVQRRDVYSQQYSNELEFKYASDWLNGVFGFFYFHENQHSINTAGLGPNFGQAHISNLLAGKPLSPPAVAIPPVPVLEIDGVAGPLKPIDPLFALDMCNVAGLANAINGPLPAPKRVCVNTTMGTDAGALFSQWVVNLGKFVSELKSISIKLGGRMSVEDLHVFNPAIVIARNGQGPVLERTSAGTFNSRNFRDFTPEVGAEWRPADDLMIYYTYSEGFKAGAGENNIAADGKAPSVIVNPETIQNHEFGLKSTWFDRRLAVNVSGYFYHLQGSQINKTIAGGPAGFDTIFQSAASTSAHGIEAEVAAQPVDRLRFNGTFAWLESHYDNFLTKDPENPVNISGSPFFNPAAPDIQLRGNRTRNSPEWAANAHVEIDIPELTLPYDGMLTIMGDVSYKSQIFFTEFNTQVDGSKPYTMFDTNLRYVSGNGRFTADFWAKNLTDVFRPTSTFELSTARDIGVTYLPPRTYGFSVGYKF